LIVFDSFELISEGILAIDKPYGLASMGIIKPILSIYKVGILVLRFVFARRSKSSLVSCQAVAGSPGKAKLEL
jgi:hypothetical protein